MPVSVVVVGAINVDLVAQVERRPSAGETVLATGFERRGGGKAANQAAAAARAGVEVGLIAVVGDDVEGRAQRAQLRAEGVDVGGIRRCRGVSTGVALVTVTPDAENAIVVVPGANALLQAAEVTELLLRTTASVVVGQTEVSAAAIDAAAGSCRASGRRFVLNAAPVVSLRHETVSLADPLVVNEHEAAELGGYSVGVARAESARKVAQIVGARSVVVTFGAAGAALFSTAGLAVVPAVKTAAVDTTGAATRSSEHSPLNCPGDWSLRPR